MPTRRLAVATLTACLFAAGAWTPARVGALLWPLPGGAAAPAPGVALRDPDGRLVDPFLAAEDKAAVVFIFASVECPVSNRYAPTVQRLFATYAARNVAFWLVYPNPGDTPQAVRAHLVDYGYPVHALLDPRHELVKRTGVTITPEAAVFDRARRQVYRGRIDNRYVSFGVERPSATEHDLADAIGAVLAGTPVRERPAPAVGCFIADFAR